MEALKYISPFQKMLNYFKEESEYQAMGTVSVIGDLLVFNHLSKAFSFIIIRIERSPAGMLTFSVDHIRPVGQRYPGATLTVYFEVIEWFENVMVLLFTIKEVIVFIILFMAYQKEKKITKSTLGAKEAQETNRKDAILRGSTNDQANGLIKQEIKIDRDYLQKFYKDETTGREVTGDDPSLWLAIKNTLRSDQRVLLYATAVLIIPLVIIHQMWH